MDPNEDVVRLDCGHYDLESLSYVVNDGEHIICPRCYSEHERELSRREAAQEQAISHKAVISVLDAFLLGLSLLGGSK